MWFGTWAVTGRGSYGPPIHLHPVMEDLLFVEYISDLIIPLEYTKININVKVGVHNEEFGRGSEL
jgi:hypothetical protein